MTRSILAALLLLAGCGGAGEPPARTEPAAPPARTAGEPRRVQAVPGAPGVVDSILLFRGAAPNPVQVLVPEENGTDALPLAERITTPDLDFDGEPDLALLSLSAGANSLTEYWRYNAMSGRFQPLGVFDTFRPDSAAREWVNFNRGGHAGRIWTAGRFRVADSRVVQTRREAQDVSEETGRYFRTVHELRAGAFVETARRPVSEDSLVAGPSWEAKP
ncbi:MAG TPA: hypothetical protein VE913_16665 [Longimicrobium sp.]|nr:hypothetical protein [Longimicrobium sp.]